MARNKDEVFELLRLHGADLRAYGVSRLGLFGSFLSGRQVGTSDIDLLVEFEEGKKSFDNFMRLAFYLEELLGRKVELLTPESLSPYIAPHILGQVEYASIAA